MAGLEDEIKTLVGEPLNLGSPKQLGDVLFGKMGLPGGRKTPTGQWATDAKLLEDLAAQGHDLPRRILDWRQLSKLKSTYTDALPGFVNPQTNRSIPRSRSPRPRPGACPPPIRTCRTSRSATSRAARSGPPLWRSRATS